MRLYGIIFNVLKCSNSITNLEGLRFWSGVGNRYFESSGGVLADLFCSFILEFAILSFKFFVLVCFA